MTKRKVFMVLAVCLCLILLVSVLVLPTSANIIYDGYVDDYYGVSCGFEFVSYRDDDGFLMGGYVPMDINSAGLETSSNYYMTYSESTGTHSLDVTDFVRDTDSVSSNYFGTVSYANQFFDISYVPGWVPIEHVDNPNFEMACNIYVELEYILESDKSSVQFYSYGVRVPMSRSLSGDGTYSFNEAYSNPIAVALGSLLLDIGVNDRVVAYGRPYVEYGYIDASDGTACIVGGSSADFAYFDVKPVGVTLGESFEHLVSALYEPPITIVEPASSMFDWLGSTLAGVMSVPLFMFGDFPLTLGGLFFSILAVFALFFVFRAFAGG